MESGNPELPKTPSQFEWKKEPVLWILIVATGVVAALGSAIASKRESRGALIPPTALDHYARLVDKIAETAKGQYATVTAGGDSMKSLNEKTERSRVLREEAENGVQLLRELEDLEKSQFVKTIGLSEESSPEDLQTESEKVQTRLRRIDGDLKRNKALKKSLSKTRASASTAN